MAYALDAGPLFADADDDFFDPGVLNDPAEDDRPPPPGNGGGDPRAGAASARYGDAASSDEEDDDDDPADAIRVDGTPRVETLRDAYAFVRKLVDAQLERARDERAPSNVAVQNDGVARGALLLLLPEPLIRRLFLELVAKPATWPRIRPLFGSPPYHFLHPNDAAALNASGFAHGRQRMAYDEGGRIANVAQFAAQFEDTFARQYRLVLRQPQDDDPIPSVRHVAALRTPTVELHVKIRKRSRAKKLELARTSKQMLQFPKPGERLLLRETRALTRVRRARQPERFEAQVIATRSRGRNAHTAALLVKWE